MNLCHRAVVTFLCTLCLGLLPTFALAEMLVASCPVPGPAVRAENPAEQTEADDTFLGQTFGLVGKTFDTTLRHDLLSRSLETMSLRLDSFFGSELYYEEDCTTDSYASFKLTSSYQRGGELDLEPRLRLRIDLPRTERQFRVRFELEDDEYDDEELGSRAASSDHLDDNDVSASLQFLLEERRNWQISVSPGLRIRELDPYVKFRLRRSGELGDWRTRFVQAFEWFESTGFGSKSTFAIDRRIGRKSLLRLTSQAYRNEDEFRHNDFEISQRIRVLRALSEHVALSAEVGVYGHTEPHWRHDRYFTNLRWRRDVHKGYVFFEVKPQLDFRHADDFAAEASLTLTLEVLYGASYRGL